MEVDLHRFLRNHIGRPISAFIDSLGGVLGGAGLRNENFASPRVCPLVWIDYSALQAAVSRMWEIFPRHAGTAERRNARINLIDGQHQMPWTIFNPTIANMARNERQSCRTTPSREL